MTVRKSKNSDKEELIRLTTQMYLSTKEKYPETKNKYREFKNLPQAMEEKIENYLNNSDYIVFVLVDNDKLRGYISGKINEKKGRVYDKEGYLENWYVEEDLQSKGLGKELYESLVEEFKRQNCTHIEVGAIPENADVIEIYEHLGYTKILITYFKLLK